MLKFSSDYNTKVNRGRMSGAFNTVLSERNRYTSKREPAALMMFMHACLPFFSLLTLCLVTQSAWAVASSGKPTQTPGSSEDLASVHGLLPDNKRNDMKIRRSVHKFSELSQEAVFRLTGRNNRADLRFGVRSDEVVKEAVLNMHYTPSPALIKALSHLKLYLNGEIVGTLTIPEDYREGAIKKKISLSPYLMSSYNVIKMEFIGHYTDRCEDPMHSAMWVDISKNSTLSLSLQKLIVKGDLEQLPKPFFDVRDYSALRLPFVFPKDISMNDLQGAGVLASYFGALADWRGSTFPVYIDALPDNHAIVFATNKDKPRFMSNYPDVDQPTLHIVNHPGDRYFKLLLVLGRDWNDLQNSAKGLALGSSIMSGKKATITKFESEPRVLNDAPRWIRTDRPVKFGELVDDLSQLQVKGYEPPPIRVSMRMPPDLFTWQSSGVTIDLAYRYSAPITLDESRLNVSINDSFLSSFHLDERGVGGDINRLRVPLIERWLYGPEHDLMVPAFNLGLKNQLQFKYSFNRLDTGECRGDLMQNILASIDADSTIDFSGHEHYAVMPNLSLFSHAGYPFTRMADLSESVVVLNSELRKEAIYAYLNMLGRIGASTGYPALNHHVASVESPDQFEDRDIFYIGTMPQSLIKAQDEVDLPLLINHSKRAFVTTSIAEKNGFTGHEFELEHDDVSKSIVEIESKGVLGAMVGVESPYTAGRSIVALTASSDKNLASISERFNDSGLIQHMRGSLVVFRSNSVESFTVGETYAVGRLPTMSLIWYHLSQYPLLMAFLTLLLILFALLFIWQVIMFVFKKRTRAHS